MLNGIETIKQLKDMQDKTPVFMPAIALPWWKYDYKGNAYIEAVTYHDSPSDSCTFQSLMLPVGWDVLSFTPGEKEDTAGFTYTFLLGNITKPAFILVPGITVAADEVKGTKPQLEVFKKLRNDRTNNYEIDYDFMQPCFPGGNAYCIQVFTRRFTSFNLHELCYDVESVLAGNSLWFDAMKPLLDFRDNSNRLNLNYKTE